jgi:radical SAM protein with 4Fe4S-binding SPASM domain
MLFNRYTTSYVKLDERQAFALDLIDGRRSCRQVEARLAGWFRLPARDAKEIARETARLLGHMNAIRYRAADGEPVDRPPGRPELPAEGLQTPYNVTWEVTGTCNLRCAHCMVDAGGQGPAELDTAQALRLIDDLAEARVLQVTLCGGEPFLRKDIVTLLERLAGTNMWIGIATNGYRVPRHVLKALERLPVFYAQVSIDGIGPQHDAFRGRKGAFGAVCASIKRLQEAGIDVCVNASITRHNIADFEKIIDLAVELGCVEVRPAPVLPVGRGGDGGAHGLGPADLLRYLRVTREKIAEYAGVIHISAEGCDTFFSGRPQSLAADGPMGCAAGHSTLNIGPDGTAYPCPFLRDFPLGNLTTESLETIWRSPVMQALRGMTKARMGAPCRDCAYAPAACAGGCRVYAYRDSGDVTGVDTSCLLPLLRTREGRKLVRQVRRMKAEAC